MTPQDLRDACIQSQKDRATLGLDPAESRLIVTLPGNSRGVYRGMLGRDGPRGRIVGQKPGRDIVDFRAVDVLAWLDRMENNHG